MSTDRDFIDYVAEQIGLGSRLSHRKMFGEYALYVDGKVVAFACDNSLFVKPSAAAT
jgi:TfoX/Sxy family transcriptional regulator of competence genes